MKGLLRPLLLPLLRRRLDEVERAARSFAIEDDSSRDLVRQLGRAFLGGFNAMLEAPRLAEVERLGRAFAPHWQPFFFEGAAMGYLPRSMFAGDASRERMERDLLDLDPAFRYLYYVGIGFWYGFRHPRRPERIAELGASVDPFHLPLCWDGWGFKRGFFDHTRGADVPGTIARAPVGVRAQAWQGFGRSLFFVCMDDSARFDDVTRSANVEYRRDMEFGRSLALAFTGIDRPAGIAQHLRSARNDDELGARLTGVTWALTARRMNDPDYFRACLDRADAQARELFSALPALCEAARADARDYADWQERSRVAAVLRYAACTGRDPG